MAHLMGWREPYQAQTASHIDGIVLIPQAVLFTDMTFLKQNWFKLCIVVASFIVAISLYQSLVIAPREEVRRKEVQEEQEEIEIKIQTQLRNTCLRLASSKFGVLLGGDPEMANQTYKMDQDNCYRQYPVK